jgi:hypothetical protein
MKKDEILIIFKLLLIKNNVYERYILSLRTLHKPNGIDIKHFANTRRSTDWVFVAFGWLNENKMYNDFVNWSEMHKKWIKTLWKIG